jgi:hypothetical protein
MFGTGEIVSNVLYYPQQAAFSFYDADEIPFSGGFGVPN